MKIHLAKKLKQVASSLVTVLVVCAIMSMSISYYLSLVEQQNILSSRSQCWNMAMTITEAGLEEGLQQINSNSSNLAADGWTYDGTLYWRSNTMPDGSAYSVNINFSNPNSPIIIARAYVAAATQTKLFGAVNVNVTTPAPVTRAIRVKASRGSLFLNALVAKHTIDLNGNGIMSDSYDSGDPSKSNNGKYDSSKAGDMGDIASNDGVVNALDIGNANIYGHAHVGPGGSMDIGPNGAIGEHSWQATHSGSAETGWFASDANFTFPGTGFPYSNNAAGVLNTAPGGDVVTTSYAFSTNGGYASSTYPTGVSPWAAITTNTFTTDIWGAVPTPTPYGTTTNYTTQYLNNQSLYPSPGTYFGPVTTNYSGQSGNIKTYSYYRITSTHYTYPQSYAVNHSFSTNSVYTTNHFDHILVANTSYYMNSLTGSTYVAGMDVKLVVANGIDLSLPFVISQSGAAQVWTGGTSITLSGNDGANLSGNASSFILYCAPSVTSLTLNGNAQFVGVLVAPTVDVTLNGGGNSNVDFCGSMMVNSATLNGHFSFHYDESLQRATKQGRYLVTTWDEIP